MSIIFQLTNRSQGKTMKKNLQEIHSEALKRFDASYEPIFYERQMCLEDRRFCSISGATWEGSLGEQFENKPKLEFNKIELAVNRIMNEYKNNRISVNFESKEGEEYDALADTCDNLLRSDEQYSVADEAYDNAFDEGVKGGFGAWRLTTRYEDEYDEDNEKQRIIFEPIVDADSSVFFDINSKRQDKSDAKYCFVITAMSEDSFKDEYGEDNESSFSKPIMRTQFDWYTPDVVYVAEYYVVEAKSEMIYTYVSLDGEEERYTDHDFENDDTLKEHLASLGYKETKSRKIKRKTIHKYIINGNRVLEDCGIIAGKEIPIVPYYGTRFYVDNVERCKGHVRNAKDAQRLKNMQLSKLAEISSLSSASKPIFTPEQIAGHAQMWADDNIKDYPYLLINPVTDASGNTVIAPPVGESQPPQVPPALGALLQVADADIQEILGNQQAGEQIMPNISGKAVELIQNRLDMQSYGYIYNFAKAIKRSGEIWLSMAPDVYVESGRKMKTLSNEGKVGSVELMRPVINKDTMEVEYENDLSQAKFDLTVEVGASSQSKRDATVRALQGMMQMTSDPETMQVLSAMAMMNMEGEGLADTREYFRNKLLMIGAVKPTEEEQAQLQMQAQSQQPSAQDQYLKSAALEAQAKAQKAQSDAMAVAANTELTKAKTIETLTNVDASHRQTAIDTAKAISEITNSQQLQQYNNAQMVQQ